MIIKLLVDGGAMKPGPALSQKLGPAGIPINNVISKVNVETKAFEGIQVPVELDVNPSTREFEVRVFSPPTSGLIKKELKIEKGSGLQSKFKNGNASIEQIISIAKSKQANLLCKDLKTAVKTIAGTCGSLGILIENKPAKEVEKEIADGKYDKEIKAEKTETSPEKKKQLEQYFTEIKKNQDKLLKQEQAAKESAEAAAKAAPVATAAATTAPAAKAAAPAKKK